MKTLTETIVIGYRRFHSSSKLLRLAGGERGLKWLRLRIYIGESDRHKGKPLYLYLLEEFRRMRLRGATVFRGIAGFGSHSIIHVPHVLRLSEDMPIVIEVVDEEENIQKALELVKRVVREGLVTIEPVEVVFYGPHA